MYFKTFYNLTTQNMNDGFLLWLRKSNLYVKYKDLKHEHFVIAKEFTFKRNKSIKMKDECSQFKNNVL